MNRQQIHWFPGHMKSAMSKIQEVLKVVDLIIEVGDARAPISSLNPYLKPLLKDKTKVLVFSKLDLADDTYFDTIKEYYKNDYQKVLFLDLKKKRDIDLLTKSIADTPTKKKEKFLRLGLNPPSLRALVVGIPNVGKSTLINSLSKSRKAGVGNIPGFTKSQQLIKVSKDLELLDTPGILPPNYDDRYTATRLAYLGSIKTDILPLDDLVLSLTDFLLERYPTRLESRYAVSIKNKTALEYLGEVALARHYLKRAGEPDLERAMKMLLKEFQSGDLGKVNVDEFKGV